MSVCNIAHSTGEHDGLVVAAHLAGDFFFESAEIASQIGTTKFVIESSCADRPFQHDLQGRNDASRFAVIAFPRLG